MSYTCFNVEVDKGIAHIQMCRPDKLNSMIKKFWTELPDLLNDLDASGEVRVAVLSAQGKHFTAGMALENFGDNSHSGDPTKRDNSILAEGFRRSALSLQGAFTTIEQVRFPVLVAIQGACVGGGVDMVTACDMRYATEDAWFCIHEINIGMTADVGTLQRLPKLVAPGLVREWAYTGERISAARAQEAGLVNRVFANHQELLDGVMEIAKTIAAKPPLAVYGTKASINYTRDHSVADGLDFIATWNASMLSSKDLMEGLTAQQEKREPEYPNLGTINRYGEA